MAKETEPSWLSKENVWWVYTYLQPIQNMIKEMSIKISLYNLFRRIYRITREWNNLRRMNYATKQITSICKVSIGISSSSFDIFSIFSESFKFLNVAKVWNPALANTRDVSNPILDELQVTIAIFSLFVKEKS